MTNEKLNLLGDFFNKRKYLNVIEIIQQNNEFQFNKILTEMDAEVAALAAFSFFNVKEFNKSLFYSSILLRHLENSDRIGEAQDLYENLIIITVDAYENLNKDSSTYFFLKRKFHKVKHASEELRLRYQKIREKIANRLGKLLNYFFILAGFVIVICQLEFQFLDPITYMGVLIMLIVIIYLIWKRYRVLIDLIKNVL